jgi:hypothetical protein
MPTNPPWNVSLGAGRGAPRLLLGVGVSCHGPRRPHRRRARGRSDGFQLNSPNRGPDGARSRAFLRFTTGAM